LRVGSLSEGECNVARHWKLLHSCQIYADTERWRRWREGTNQTIQTRHLHSGVAQVGNECLREIKRRALDSLMNTLHNESLPLVNLRAKRSYVLRAPLTVQDCIWATRGRVHKGCLLSLIIYDVAIKV